MPGALIYWLIFKPILNRKWIIYSLIVTVLGFLPSIIFDFTHSFVNFERLLSIFKLAVTGVAPPISKVVLTLISNSVSYYYVFSSLILRTAIFGIIILVCLIGAVRDEKYRKILILSMLFLFIPFIFFLFYRSNFSEYYLMSAVPPFIILSGYVFEKINKYLLITLVLVIFLAFINIKVWKVYTRSINLWAKEQVVQTIVKMGGKTGYGVSLSVDAGYGFGYPFLFEYYGATPNIPPLKNQKEIFTIIVPSGYKDIPAMETFDGIGLRWQGI
jgi:4-amino-4-deoxy-L-arabinose transferase-like glycosyltransferase